MNRRTLTAALAAVAVLIAAPAASGSIESTESTEGEQSAAPTEFDTYQLVLLVRPDEPTEHPPERAREIQAAHLDHLGKMARQGHLVAAGPFADQDDERYRGLALYRVGGVEEARRLAERDPAVKAGRLEVEVMTWYTEKGAVAFPGVEAFAETDESGEPEGSGTP